VKPRVISTGRHLRQLVAQCVGVTVTPTHAHAPRDVGGGLDAAEDQFGLQAPRVEASASWTDRHQAARGVGRGIRV